MESPFHFRVSGDDPLGVLTSCAPVLENARHVRIDSAAVQSFAAKWAGHPPPVLEEEQLHCTFLDDAAFLNYLLVLESINFCFWDNPPRWEVVYQGQRHDGYWALAAALHRGVREDGLPLWDAGWMAGLDAPALAHLLRGEGRPIPMLNDRLAHLREAGRVLLERWEGQFANLLAASGGDAVRLVRGIVEAFPSFRDQVHWNVGEAHGAVGHTVRFHKRAQIFAADLSRLLAGRPAGKLGELRHLTAFADYKVPQVMRGEGMLVYAPSLATRLERREELPPGSGEEVEIRAATLWGCEWLVREFNRIQGGNNSGGEAPGQPPVTAMDVDYRLWAAGQNHPALQPYHRTRTIYY